MSEKRPVKKQAEKKETAPLPSMAVRIDRLVNLEGSRVRAAASVNLAGAFAIHGLKVVDSEKGLFVSMPQNRYEKEGRTQYSDICHPITAQARAALSEAVLAAYEQRLEEEEGADFSELTNAWQTM